MFGYLLLAHRDGWAGFCAAHRLPPDGLNECLVGGRVLADAEADAEAAGVTGETMRRFFRRAGEEPSGPLRTTDTVAAEVTEAFAARLAFWEGEGR